MAGAAAGYREHRGREPSQPLSEPTVPPSLSARHCRKRHEKPHFRCGRLCDTYMRHSSVKHRAIDNCHSTTTSYLLLGPRRVWICRGHQWKRVVERISAGCCCKSAQRASCTSSSSSIVAKCWLMRTELVNGHRCSAGWSSGEYGGRNNRCTCSGTRRRTLLCQPARSN